MIQASASLMPLMCAASDAQVQAALREAQRLFGNALACWASDLFNLQRRGFDVPTWTGAPARSRSSLRKAA